MQQIGKVVRITGQDKSQVDRIASLIESVSAKIEPEKLEKLLSKANEKPSLISKALMFI